MWFIPLILWLACFLILGERCILGIFRLGPNEGGRSKILYNEFFFICLNISFSSSNQTQWNSFPPFFLNLNTLDKLVSLVLNCFPLIKSCLCSQRLMIPYIIYILNMCCLCSIVVWCQVFSRIFFQYMQHCLLSDFFARYLLS